MSRADDIIEARCKGASLDDIYSSLRSGIPLVGIECRDSLKTVKDLLVTTVAEVSESVSENNYSGLRESAKMLNEIAAMLESVCDDMTGRGNGDGAGS